MQSPAGIRYCPDESFPAYSYVPGRFPHPISDAAGHSFGHELVVIGFSPAEWEQCQPYLFGLDLFNHGYYWEAHEYWEAVWLAVGRKGLVADLLKGLIKLAAAGVKIREQKPNGIRRHANRAQELFNTVRSEHESLLGLCLADLDNFARWIESAADSLTAECDDSVTPLFDRRLVADVTSQSPPR